MIRKNLNCAFAVYQGRALPVVKDGDIITRSNLAQMERDTPLFEGVKDLTFEDCNLVNVRLDPTWNVKGCNVFQGDYNPAEIFPDESVAREQAQREAVKDAILSSYSDKVLLAMAEIAAGEVTVESVEAVIAAKAAPIKPIGKELL